MMPVRPEPMAPLSRVKHSTTEPLRSLFEHVKDLNPAKLGDDLKEDVSLYQVHFSLFRTEGEVLK